MGFTQVLEFGDSIAHRVANRITTCVALCEDGESLGKQAPSLGARRLLFGPGGVGYNCASGVSHWEGTAQRGSGAEC